MKVKVHLETLVRVLCPPAILALVLTGCAGAATQAPAKSVSMLDITVSIVPQKCFVERVGGEHVNVNVMVQPGNSPATYEPKPEQLTALSEAAAYVSIGVPFEDVWLTKIASANSEMLMVDTTRGIKKAGNDPHIWLSPALVKTQAQTIYEALAQIDPTHQAEYEANLDSFIADIVALDADIRKTLEGTQNNKFMVFHPAWGYFARDFGLEMIPIKVGGQEPSAAELADLVTRAKEEGIKVIFCQPEFSTRDAETIANEIGGQVLLISALSPDWLDNLRNVVDTFAEVLGQ